MMEKRKRKELNFTEKVTLIKESTGVSQRKLAEKFGIGKTQVQSILKRKAEIMEEYDENEVGDRKRLCKRSPVEELNMLMWEWFQKVIQQGVRVSGPMLQEKALVFARDLQIPESDFKASKGWLNRFRDRHNISFQKVCGESGSVDKETVNQWNKKLPELIKGYADKDIYNMDETGLYYRAMPDKTLFVKGEEVKGGKRSKDRLTVMLCVNMSGDFEIPLVIGKAKQPRAFKNIKVSNLPIIWEWNKKAWMTSSIFVTWVKEFNKKMKRQDRHVILFLDNATSHPSNLELSNVRIQFLPKNTTSVLQPLDQGIIQNMKMCYRKRLIRHVLCRLESSQASANSEDISKSVNVLSAVRFLNGAICDIKSETVMKCFIKAGFKVGSSDVESDEDYDDDDDIPIAQLVREMRVRNIISDEMDLNEYSNVDEDIQIHEELSLDWESQLVENTRHEMNGEKKQPNENDTDDDNDEDDKPCEQPKLKSHNDAVEYIEHLRDYSLSKELLNAFEMFGAALDIFEKESVKVFSSSKQTTIDKFFK